VIVSDLGGDFIRFERVLDVAAKKRRFPVKHPRVVRCVVQRERLARQTTRACPVAGGERLARGGESLLQLL